MLEISPGNKGKFVSVSSDMCGEIYIFDQATNIMPQFVCAKIPKRLINSIKKKPQNKLNSFSKLDSFSNFGWGSIPGDAKMCGVQDL